MNSLQRRLRHRRPARVPPLQQQPSPALDRGRWAAVSSKPVHPPFATEPGRYPSQAGNLRSSAGSFRGRQGLWNENGTCAVEGTTARTRSRSAGVRRQSSLAGPSLAFFGERARAAAHHACAQKLGAWLPSHSLAARPLRRLRGAAFARSQGGQLSWFALPEMRQGPS